MAETFVIPHVLEKSGTVSSTQYTFDTTLFLTYNGSVRGDAGGSASVEVYLYDEAGQPMQGSTAEVWAPCNYSMGGKQRNVSIRLDDLITGNGGGFDTPVKLGFAVVVVSGPGAEAVNLQVVTMNSKTSAFDVAVFGFDPPPISSSAARTVVLPHVLETSGRVATDPYSFDTTIFMTYAGGLPGTASEAGAQVDLYLYDQTGAPMESTNGTAVCAPCTFALGNGAGGAPGRKQTAVLDNLIQAAGGFGSSSVRLGFAVVRVTGQDPGDVAPEGYVVNAHTGPFDLSVFGFDPQPIEADAAASSRSFVIPHILEKSGTSASTQYTFDTTLFATYTPGLAGTPQGGGASLDFYLYDDSGAAMVGNNGTPVCAPCTYPLGAGARKQAIRMEDLMNAAGGFDTPVKTGFGVAVIGGADPSGVALQGFVVNSHTSPFDLSVFGFQPQEVQAARADASNSVPRRAFVAPHVFETMGRITDTQFTFDTTLFATYVGGLAGGGGGGGGSATLNLYLFDADSGLPLQGAAGEVCNPCMFAMSDVARKQTINIEDLIVNQGGGFGGVSVKSASSLLVVDGDAGNVNLQGSIVNAHTSAFDLSVFGFEPQPLASARMVPLPIGINAGPGRHSLSIPTVIGGQYEIEARDMIDATGWSMVDSFEGDGTVQVRPLPPGGADEQYFRVKGY